MAGRGTAVPQEGPEHHDDAGSGGARRGIALLARPMKRCPYCAELIQDTAIKCRYCGSMLPGASVHGAPSDPLDAEALQVLASEGRIAAIRFVRERKGYGLAQAKQFVDRLDPGGARRVRVSAAGCASVLAVLVATLVVVLVVLRGCRVAA